MTRPEFSRPFALDRLGAAATEVAVEATAQERAALATRLAIPAVRSLRCTFSLVADAARTVAARGELAAEVVQTCVVTLEDFASEVRDSFGIRFVPEGAETDDADPETEDEVTYAGGMLDLGEAAAQQLALSLDAYPRRPDAELPDVHEEVPSGPFARLATLRRPT